MSNSEVYGYLMSRLGLTFYDKPVDYTEEYTYKWISSRGGSIMPPSPGAKSYVLHWVQDEEGFKYAMDIDWHPSIDELRRRIPKWQQFHRSRKCAISASAARINELERRRQRLREYMPSVNKHKVSDSESSRMYQAFLSILEKHLVDDPQWRRQFLDDHRHSSLGEGYKYTELFTMSNDQFADVLSQLRENIQLLRNHEGQWTNIMYNAGIRARSDELDNLDSHQEGTVEFSRIITFHIAFQLWTLFIKDKKAWYTETFDEWGDILNVTPEFILPYNLGGKVYLKAAELFNNGLEFKAYDGKSWDSVAGELLGPAFRPVLTYLVGHPMVATGSSFTSLLDTGANQVHNRNAHCTLLALGDDMNAFSGEPTRAPYVEFQPGDTQAKYILGASFDEPQRPKLCGIKATSDRSKLMKPILWFPDVQSALVTKKRDTAVRAAWFNMFFSRYGKGTLLEALANIKEFLSPGEQIEQLVEDETNFADQFTLAQELGVQQVFA